MAILIGIDIGTTSWKAAAFRFNGEMVAIQKTPTVTQNYAKGQNFYDPQQLWRDTSEIIKKVIESCDKEEIAGISVSSMAESVVPINSSGETCFPIIPWFDTRSIQEANKANSLIGRQRLFELTGLDPNPVFSLLKIAWIKQNFPDIYRQATKWLQMADYIYMKLCGVQVTDHSLATRTMAYDLKKGSWSEEILSAMDIPVTVFPEIIMSGTCIGKVNKAASLATGLPEGTPVVVGGNDHPCATIPAGVLSGKKILNSSGTAESFLYLTEKQDHLLSEYRGQRVCSYLDPNMYVVWGESSPLVLQSIGPSTGWPHLKNGEETDVSYPLGNSRPC